MTLFYNNCGGDEYTENLTIRLQKLVTAIFLVELATEAGRESLVFGKLSVINNLAELPDRNLTL